MGGPTTFIPWAWCISWIRASVGGPLSSFILLKTPPFAPMVEGSTPVCLYQKFVSMYAELPLVEIWYHLLLVPFFLYLVEKHIRLQPHRIFHPVQNECAKVALSFEANIFQYCQLSISVFRGDFDVIGIYASVFNWLVKSILASLYFKTLFVFEIGIWFSCSEHYRQRSKSVLNKIPAFHVFVNLIGLNNSSLQSLALVWVF